MPAEPYEVRSSRRRTRTMTAFREEGRLVVVVPEHMSARQRRDLIPGLVERYLTKEARQRPPRADQEITQRAIELYRAYVAPHTEQEEPVIGARWVTMPNWAPPRQPVSVSKPSSSAPLMTMCFRLTLPPKISMPSSDEL